MVFSRKDPIIGGTKQRKDAVNIINGQVVKLLCIYSRRNKMGIFVRSKALRQWLTQTDAPEVQVGDDEGDEIYATSGASQIEEGLHIVSNIVTFLPSRCSKLSKIVTFLPSKCSKLSNIVTFLPSKCFKFSPEAVTCPSFPVVGPADPLGPLSGKIAFY